MPPVSATLWAICPSLQGSRGSPGARDQPVPKIGWVGASLDLRRSMLDAQLRFCEKVRKSAWEAQKPCAISGRLLNSDKYQEGEPKCISTPVVQSRT